MFGNLFHFFASSFKYYVLFTGDYTFNTWLYFLKHKSTVLHYFRTFLTYVNAQFSTKIQRVHSDGGCEYDNGPFKTFCPSLAVHHRLSCPHTLA